MVVNSKFILNILQIMLKGFHTSDFKNNLETNLKKLNIVLRIRITGPAISEKPKSGYHLSEVYKWFVFCKCMLKLNGHVSVCQNPVKGSLMLGNWFSFVSTLSVTSNEI